MPLLGLRVSDLWSRDLLCLRRLLHQNDFSRQRCKGFRTGLRAQDLLFTFTRSFFFLCFEGFGFWVQGLHARFTFTRSFFFLTSGFWPSTPSSLHALSCLQKKSPPQNISTLNRARSLHLKTSSAQEGNTTEEHQAFTNIFCKPKT